MHGRQEVDREFAEFLLTLESWTYKRLDNVEAPLLKLALIELGAFKGRLDGAVMTRHTGCTRRSKK